MDGEEEEEDRNIWLKTSWKIACSRASFWRPLIPLFLTWLNNSYALHTHLLEQVFSYRYSAYCQIPPPWAGSLHPEFPSAGCHSLYLAGRRIEPKYKTTFLPHLHALFRAHMLILLFLFLPTLPAAITLSSLLNIRSSVLKQASTFLTLCSVKTWPQQRRRLSSTSTKHW